MSTYVPKVAADFETTLSAQAVEGDTSITLTSVTDSDGNALASGLYAFTLDGDVASRKEFIIGTLSGTTVSSISSISSQGVETANIQNFHARGASVAITDWAVIERLTRVSSGLDGFDASAPLFYDADPSFADDQQIVTKKYVDDLVNGGSVSYNQLVLTSQTAGENLAEFNHVYFKESDQRWYKVDADSTSTYQMLKRGYANATQTTGGSLSIVINGRMSGFTGLTAGSKYYASNTAGAISTTPGTNTIYAGTAISTTVMIVDMYVRDIPYGNEKDALAGSQGVPGSSNAYVTEDNLSAGGTDQSQLTANGTSVVGAASTTGNRNRIAQSFIPTKTKIRGANLYKQADTGTFTGTVTVAVQADSSGSPSNSNLASVTLTNAEWLALPVGAFTAVFGTEYASLTVGSLYWIVVTTSTADSSNHPNLGINTGGGYASGSAKFYNATDNWTVIATIDFYFATLEGTVSQAITSTSGGQLANVFIGDALKTLSGVLPATFQKTYYTFHSPFMLWTGSTSGAATTDFQNWLRNDATDVVTAPNGAYASFASTDAAYLIIEDPIRTPAGAVLQFSDSQVVIMDFCAAIASADDSVHFGLGNSNTAFTQDIAGNTRFVGFATDGSTLYAKTSNNSAQTLTTLTGYTLSRFLNYRIEADFGADSANFYINGALVATIATTFPGTAVDIDMGFGREDDATFTVTAPYVSVELNP